jgi:tetratricopeptide (TPR) repeat protein
MKFGILVLLLISAAAWSADPSLDAALAKLEEGRGTLEQPVLEEAKAAFEACSKSKPEDFYCVYELARADFCLASSLDFQGKRGLAKERLETAIAEMRRALEIKESSAEAHAILGMMLGAKIGWGGVFEGMRTGPKSKQQTERALALDPKNPVVELGLGLQYLNSPAFVGGSATKALEHLKRSVELDPNVDDAWYWLAKAYHKLGDRAGFEQAMQRVFKLQPKNALAKKEIESWPLTK